MLGHCAVPLKPRTTSPSHTATRFRLNTYKSASKLRTLSTFRCNTYKKPGGGGRSRSIPIPPSPILRTHFQVPYALTPLLATLAKTAGVCTNNSHSGTHVVRSFRKRLRVDPRHQLQRIFVVHLLQDFIRHLEAVNSPESMALAV